MTSADEVAVLPGTPAGGPTDAAPRAPKYYGLKQHLLHLAQTQPPGTPVPSERVLAEEFATSRTTVRQALQELVGEGRLQRLHGKGTFVARPKIAQPLVLSSYTEDTRRRGAAPSSTVLSTVTDHEDGETAARLGLAPDEPLVRLERLRLADGEPMAIEQSHLSARRFPGLLDRLAERGSLYAALREDFDVEPFEAEETIETGAAGPVEAALLGTETGLPVLLLSRLTLDGAGQPFEFVRATYRGDRFKLVARLVRPS
jgi:GntR family transcriptional regulator